MKEIEILEDEKITDYDKTIQLPTNFITIGEIDVDDVKIYIKQDVYKEIEKFSKKDTSCECGGILIGDYVEVSNKKNVIISAFIEAKYTDASASTLTFTHETWDYIHNEQEDLYPEKKIIGWQHTHPDYGIFLSNYDLFIQDNFFNLPWQIAYVVDPIAQTRGFFQWKNDKVEKANGFYIFDDVETKIEIKQVKSSKPKGNFQLFFKIIIFFTIILFILTLYFGIQKFNIANNLINELIYANDQLNSQNDELVQKLQQNDNSKETTTTTQSNQTTDGVVKMKAYIIQNGDTLNEICKKNNLDYTKNKSLILKINGIANEDAIYSGQTLYLPLP